MLYFSFLFAGDILGFSRVFQMFVGVFKVFTHQYVIWCAAARDWAVWTSCHNKNICKASLPCGPWCAGPADGCCWRTSSTAGTDAVWLLIVPSVLGRAFASPHFCAWKSENKREKSHFWFRLRFVVFKFVRCFFTFMCFLVFCFSRFLRSFFNFFLCFFFNFFLFLFFLRFFREVKV